jgi:hypothetical protein
MSPTTEHLRRRIDTELDDLAPMPDATGVAVRQGRARLRRRRLAGGSLLGVAAIGGGVAVGVALTGPEPARPHHTVADPSGEPTRASAPDPLADGRVTVDERDEAVRAGLETLLPERYGSVVLLPRSTHEIQMLGTEDGQPQLKFWLATQGRSRGEETSRDEADWSCSSQGQARPILTCEEAQLGDGWFAVAVTERSGPTDEPGSTATYGTSLLLMNDGVWSELSVVDRHWDGASENEPAGLGAGELIAMAQDPAYLDMLEVDAAWQVDREFPHSVVRVPAPVWPS